MVPFYKYLIVSEDAPRPTLDIDSSFDDHCAAMGGYDPNAAYESVDSFMEQEFYRSGYGEMVFREDFILPRLGDPPRRIVSVGAGRAALEVRLGALGHDVTCTDLDIIPCITESLKLFPDLKYHKHDILAKPTDNKFEAFLALGLISLFDMDSLQRFFRNAADSIVDDGSLFVSGSSAPDNLWSRLWFRGWLPVDAHISTWIRNRFRGRNLRVYRKMHGYQCSETELEKCASAAGFRLMDRACLGTISDFRRSVFWDALRHRIPGLIAVSRRLSLLAPYSRLYHFQKGSAE